MLGSRREKASTAADAAEKAQASVTELDNRLKTTATLTTRQTQALRSAEAEAARLRQSLKAAAREKSRLTAARKKAVRRVEKAKAKQKAAEAKYDKSVLQNLVQREKERDRAQAGRPASDRAGTALAPAQDRSPVPAPAAEVERAGPAKQPDPGATTATRTADRKTAAAAGNRKTR
jgi:hypothetical protein